MAKGVRVHHLRIDTPLMGEALQFVPNGAWGDLFSVFV